MNEKREKPADNQVKDTATDTPAGEDKPQKNSAKKPKEMVKKEIGGPEGPEPTRFGDWERKGRCIDF